MRAMSLPGGSVWWSTPRTAVAAAAHLPRVPRAPPETEGPLPPITIDWRVMLFDADGRLLTMHRAGEFDAPRTVKLPISVDNRVVGYLGYDAVRHFEHKLAGLPVAGSLPQGLFLLTDTLVAFDHARRSLYLIAHAFDGDRAAAQARLDAIEARLNAPMPARPAPAAVSALPIQSTLTQAEYVQLLYKLERRTASKEDVVDALRTRGIGFALTDGVRSLTRSKGANDDELKRALEEAERRRKDPEGTKLPTQLEVAGIIDKTRRKTLEAVEEMPDFVVKQQIQRSFGYAGTGSFRPQDKLVVAVSYRSTGQESYKLLSINGAIQQNPESKGSYEEAGGSSSTGEFVTMLATIFKPENDADFTPVQTDLIRGRTAVLFDFTVERDKAKQRIVSGVGAGTQQTITGMKGRMWIDRTDFRVLRVESEATEIPEGFPVTAGKRTIDYDWTMIAEEKYLLPLVSDVRMTIRESGRSFETKNLIRFTNYQKFGTDIIIGPEDSEPVTEEKP